MKLSEVAKKNLKLLLDSFENGDIPEVVEKTLILGDISNLPSAKWTFRNRLLAYLQAGTIDCRGFKQWKLLERTVKTGSKAAYILAPMVGKKPDPDDSEKFIEYVYGYRGIPVFPDWATEGEPIPDRDFEPAELPPLLDVAKAWGIKVTWEKALDKTAYGYHTKRDGEAIVLHTDSVTTFFHELGHAADGREHELKGGQHSDQEIVADLVASVLWRMYGTSDKAYAGNTWRYVSRYAEKANKDPLVACYQLMGRVGKALEKILGTKQKLDAESGKQAVTA